MVQVVAESHETPSRTLFDPDGLGVAWIAQVLPFHCSARVAIAPEAAEPENPVAVQAVDETHEIAFSEFWFCPARLGVVWIAHLLPFQCSASGACSPALISWLPTAVQLVAELQEIPERSLPAAAADGLGTDWVVQVLPFQCSASARDLLELLVFCPTAKQLVAEGHATADNCAPSEPDSFGVVWTAHLLPFQYSASVCEMRLTALLSLPTAKQLVAAGQETPLKAGVVVPAGSGVAWIDQVVAALAGPAAHAAQAAAVIKTRMVRRMILSILLLLTARAPVSAGAQPNLRFTGYLGVSRK